MNVNPEMDRPGRAQEAAEAKVDAAAESGDAGQQESAPQPEAAGAAPKPPQESSGDGGAADGAAAEDASGPAEAAELKAALEQALAQQRELEEQHLRLRAEFENFRRRTRREVEELRERASEELITQLLPVVDNFERALEYARSQKERSAAFVDGVEMVYRQLMAVLERAGLRPVEAVGAPFDPNVHEAVAYEECEDQPEGHVFAELQRGYTLGDKLLRPSMVKVAKGVKEQGGQSE